MDKTCGFTGYRQTKLAFGYDESDPRCIALKKAIQRQIEISIADGYVHFISGFALGCDQFFAEEVLDARKNHPHIVLEAALPCETQTTKWNEEQRSRYFSLLALCDLQTYVNREAIQGAYLRRNDYIVTQSQRIIAVYDGKKGGTDYTLRMAHQRGLEITIIRP